MKAYLFIFFLPALLASSPLDYLEMANAFQIKGEEAATFQERKNFLNQALALYLEIEKQTHSDSVNLNQAIGTLFFQLEEYPFAIYYYEKALVMDPSNPLLQSQLQSAQLKLGLTSTPSSLYLSFPKQLTLAFLLFLGLIFLMTLLIWFPWHPLKIAASLNGALFTLASLCLFISYYFAPIYGILIQSTGLYATPDWLGPQLLGTSLLKGSKLRIMESLKEGYWLKVNLLNGEVGYIPASAIRLIDN